MAEGFKTIHVIMSYVTATKIIFLKFKSKFSNIFNLRTANNLNK